MKPLRPSNYLVLLATVKGADDVDQWNNMAVTLCAERVWEFVWNCLAPDPKNI